MTYNEYKGIMQGLGYAFNKEYKEQELKMFYRYFKDYTTDTFIKTVDDVITTYDKLPSLKQIIDRCDTNKRLVWMNDKVETPVEDQEWIELLSSFK